MPSTDAGKTISARNATSHGLFARDIVLPELGENPAAYNEVFLTLMAQINPTNLLEQEQVEKIAAATWRLRRLHRWQAQLWEDETLTEEARLDKLDKTLRQETALHRQVDSAVKMLGGKDIPSMMAARVRREVLTEKGQTEQDCKEAPEIEREVQLKIQEGLVFLPFAQDFDRTKFDNGHEELKTPPDPNKKPAITNFAEWLAWNNRDLELPAQESRPTNEEQTRHLSLPRSENV